MRDKTRNLPGRKSAEERISSIKRSARNLFVGLAALFASATATNAQTPCDLSDRLSVANVNWLFNDALSFLGEGRGIGGCFNHNVPCQYAYDTLYEADGIIDALIESAIAPQCNRCNLDILLGVADRMIRVAETFEEAGIGYSYAHKDHPWILKDYMNRPQCGFNGLLGTWSGRLTRSDGAGYETSIRFFEYSDKSMGAEIDYGITSTPIVATYVERVGDIVVVKHGHRCGESILEISLNGDTPVSAFGQTTGSTPECSHTATMTFY